VNTNCKETREAIVVAGLHVDHSIGATMDHLPVDTTMAMVMVATKLVHPEEDHAGPEAEAVVATEADVRGLMKTTPSSLSPHLPLWRVKNR